MEAVLIFSQSSPNPLFSTPIIPPYFVCSFLKCTKTIYSRLYEHRCRVICLSIISLSMTRSLSKLTFLFSAVINYQQFLSQGSDSMTASSIHRGLFLCRSFENIHNHCEFLCSMMYLKNIASL